MLYFLSLIHHIKSLGFDEIGTIWPSGNLPVSNSYTNANLKSDYTFTFYTDHSLPISSQISVIFPYQYPANLGQTSCKSSLGPCEISNTTVKVTLTQPLFRYETTSLTIYAIQNPQTSAGTGNFCLLSYINSNLIDFNYRFGIAGIAQNTGSLLSGGVNIVDGDRPVAGYSARYEFKFRLYRTLPAWNWVRFTFPDSGFQFEPNPTCTSFQIDDKLVDGNLTCVNSGNQVSVYLINRDIPAYANVGLRVTVQNPGFSVFTGTFGIETGKNSTLTVYDQLFGIRGIAIQPGNITRVSFKPCNESVVLAQGKEVIYRLTFLVTNPVPQGGVIQIVGSSSFQFSSYYYIEDGLVDLSSANPSTFTYTSTNFTLTLSGFFMETPQLVSLLLSMINPMYSGLSDPLTITTLTPKYQVIDENLDQACVYIEPVSSFTSLTVTGTSGTQATGSTITLQISITPQLEIPALGWVLVSLPYGFSVSSYQQTCFDEPTYESQAGSQTCFYYNGVINLQLFKDSVGVYGKFESGIASTVTISSITAPLLAGTYYFDISSFNSEMKLLESGTVKWSLGASSINPTVAAIHTGISTPTILQSDFTLHKPLPASQSLTGPTGYLEFQFPTFGASNLFPLNLGQTSGSLPCFGVSGTTGEIQCKITFSPSTPSVPVILTITGFALIPASTFISIRFAGLTYVQSSTSGSITVTSYQVNNRKRYDLETGTASFLSGSAVPAVTFSGVTLTLANKSVQSSTTLSTGTSFTTTVASGATSPYLLISFYKTHDKGYCQNASVTCLIDGTLLQCVCYPTADMILVSLSSSFSAGTHTMQISGLVTPESVPTTNDDIYLFIIGANVIKQCLSFAGAIPLLLPGGLIKSQVNPSDLGQGTVFVSYSVVVSPSHYIPQGGSIQIIFPAEYSLSASSPTPYCYTNYLHPTSGSISCSLSSNTFTITGFNYVNSGYIIVVYIKGVKNPATPSTSQFVIQTTNKNGKIIDQNNKCGIVKFNYLFAAHPLNYLNITLFPTNANTTAEYIFTFTPSSLLGAGSVIQIKFPLRQFGTLATNLTCRLSGQVTTFSKCYTSASDLFMVSDTDLPYKPLSVSVIGLKNFDRGTSDNFTLTASYDGTIVQTSTLNTSDIYVTTTTQAGKLVVSNILFSPQNEAEVATYEFYFNTRLGISSDQNIFIRFPYEFDHRLGDSIHCWAEGLTGYLECSNFHAYSLIVRKHDPLLACSSCSIILYVSGIYNPKQGNTGQFSIGILQGNTYTELNEFAGTVLIQPAPMYLEILYTVPTSLFARSLQDISFNITVNQTIPTTDNGGQIWVEFPADYVLDGSFVVCSSSEYWAGGTPNCSLSFNTLKLSGQLSPFQGNLMISTLNVPNPLADVLADYITVEVADNFHRSILARSYPNLDPNRFQYTYPGPLITVNGNLPFSVRRGTYSKPIRISLDYPAALNLTLAPSCGSFKFYPSQIVLNFGNLSASFRVAIPYDTEDKDYVILWTILGELSPPFYTPILKSSFTVTKDNLVPIYAEKIMPIPAGYSSLPVFINIDQAPQLDLTVHLSLNSITGVQLSSNALLFQSGVVVLNFTISVNKIVSQSAGLISLSISGTNTEAYYLTTSSLSFNIIAGSPLPKILAVGVIRTTRTTAEFTLTTNIFCWVYFAYALRGTQAPSFQETKSQGPPTYATTKTVYGILRVAQSNIKVFTIEGLQASARYTLFVWAEDLTGVPSGSYKSIDFDTDFISRASKIVLKFSQVYLNNVEIQKTSAAIQLYLSLHAWRVILNTGDTLQMDPNKVYSLSADWPEVSFYIIDKIDTEDYPSPFNMVQRLAAFQTKIANELNNFESDFSITGSEVVVSPCKFTDYAHVVNKTSDYRNISLAGTLEENGFIYAIAILADADPGKPFAFQVFSGNDAWNRPTLMAWVNVTGGKKGSIVFSPVASNTTYHIYVICANQNPGYLEYIKDSGVIPIVWTTQPKPPRSNFSIDFGVMLNLSWLWMCLSLIIF